MYSLVKSVILVFFVSLISSCATTSEVSSAGPSKEMMEKADKILLVVNETPEKAYKNLHSICLTIISDLKILMTIY